MAPKSLNRLASGQSRAPRASRAAAVLAYPLPMNALTPTANFDAALAAAARAAADWLVADQKPDGHWVARADSNACMEAQWCLALWFLGLEDHPLRPRLGAALLKTQRPDGAWQIYHDAPNGDINTTVEAYAALRSLGHRDDEPALTKARLWIESKGGLRNIRVFTRYWLALIGEWPWDKTPNLPPEVIWFPLWFPFSIYNFAQWARATLMPIALLSARRPSRPLPQQEPSRRAVSRADAGPSTTSCPRRRTPAAGIAFSAAPTRFCTRSRLSARAISSPSGVRRRSGTRSSGSCAIRTPTAAGAASSRPGSTASWRCASKATRSIIPSSPRGSRA